MARRSKADNQETHAKNRALERYALELSNADLRHLVSLIQGDKARFVEKQSNRVSVFDVEFKERLVRVVYDKLRHQVVSFLPFVDRRYSTTGEV